MSLVKGMKITESQMKRMASAIMNGLKQQQSIEVFKEKEENVYQRAFEIIRADFHREQALDQEVHKMMDDLERQNPNGFERYKMFPMLKKRLAKEKGIVL